MSLSKLFSTLIAAVVILHFGFHIAVHAREISGYTLITPALPQNSPIPATHQKIVEILTALPYQDDSFLILDRTHTKANDSYIQTLVGPDGYYFEYQVKDIDHHYASDRNNLTLAEITAVFDAYLAGDDSWKRHFKFQQQHILKDGSVSYSVGLNPQAHRWMSK